MYNDIDDESMEKIKVLINEKKKYQMEIEKKLKEAEAA